MTLGVPQDLQYSLIEFIAHVNAEDYDAMPNDFVQLGFTPPEQLERVKASNLTEGLSFVLRQLSQARSLVITPYRGPLLRATSAAPRCLVITAEPRYLVIPPLAGRRRQEAQRACARGVKGEVRPGH